MKTNMSVITAAAAATIICFSTFTISPAASQSPSYAGCYGDNITGRLLQGYVETFSQGLTNERCNSLCFKKGYMFAGTENGNECYCGDPNEETKLAPVDDEQCNVPCNGDSSQNCGGYLKLSGFVTGMSTILPVGKLLGCFIDNKQERILKDHKVELTGTNSPIRCLNICRLLGYKLSGVKNTHECHCGNELQIPDENGKAQSDAQCQVLKCPGDGTEFCGDVEKMMLYRTGPPDKIPDVGNVGCFRDRPGGLLNGYKDNMGSFTNPVRCMSKCFQMGYEYAGLRNGDECSCGDAPTGAPPVKVVSTRCNVTCPGNRVEFCGGDTEVSGYFLGIQKDPVNKSVACFKNDQDRDLTYGYKVDLLNTNSPVRCVNICRQLQFSYAGVENRYTCYCANSVRPVNQDTVAVDTLCSKSCSGDATQMCGGKNTVHMYETGLSQASQTGGQDCEKSLTTVNNVQVCKGAEIFKDTFTGTSLNTKKWQNVVKISGNEEYEFVVYDKNERNCYVQNSRLMLAPSELPDDLIRRGKLVLEGCTGAAGTVDCERQAVAYNINPPVQSAQVNTRHAFTFRYGTVIVRAKLPVGDWIVPQLFLKPKEEVYGPQYKSGVIRIGLVKGNENLVCDGKDVGTKYLESGVLMGVAEKIRGRTVGRTSSKPWPTRMYNYTVVWKPDSISFLVDGKEQKEILPFGVTKISEAVGFTSDEAKLWDKGTPLAPFDKEFYITLGVSVGGMREFPDDCISNGRQKPWTNLEVKAMLKFWQDRSNWVQTWNEHSRFQIESVVVKAL